MKVLNREHVVLPDHAIETLPSMVLRKTSGDPQKKKAMILPKVINLPEPSNMHPCEPNPDYSKNLCNLRFGLKRTIFT